jgi:uncharacterized coiled-coil protein SlyX
MTTLIVERLQRQNDGLVDRLNRQEVTIAELRREIKQLEAVIEWNQNQLRRVLSKPTKSRGKK